MEKLRMITIAGPLFILWSVAEALCLLMSVLKRVQGPGGRVYVSWKP